MDQTLSPEQLRWARQAAGLTQQQAARRLGVSQACLALLERGRRQVTARLATKIAKLYRLGPLALPIRTEDLDRCDSSSLASALASIGYPGFRQLDARPPRNPAIILLAALTSSDLEARIVEALPWLAVEYASLDWDWVIREAKIRDLQNRLGFVVALAWQVARKRGLAVADRLREIEQVLDRARLVREDTLCQESLSEAERRWLRQRRPAEADHWNLLTDLSAQTLPYAA